jgi:hypothetical protein
MDVKQMPTSKKIFLGAALLLLIDSFLPWYHVSFGPVSASLSGWHQLGTVAWVLLIGLLIWEGVRLAGAAPVSTARAELYSSLAAIAVLVVGVIFVIQRLVDGELGIGFWLGVILLAVFGYATLTAFRASGGSEAVRREMDQQRRPPAA